MQLIFPKSTSRIDPEVKFKKENSKMGIKKEDIIEVDFEEIKSNKSETKSE
ncbi:MAG: hypothetical protein V1720_02190 [bacterium]